MIDVKVTDNSLDAVTVGIFEGAVQANHPDLRVIAGNFMPE